MKKHFTLILAAVACICTPSWSQVASKQNASIDSLAGFNLDSVLQVAHAAGATPDEITSFVIHQKQAYVAKRFDLNGFNEQTGILPHETPQSACTNMGFETGDFTGWQGATGTNNNSSLPLSGVVAGFINDGNDAVICDPNARHTIMTSASGLDPYGQFPIVPAGYGSYVARIDGQTAGGIGNYMGEILEQTFVVDPNNTQFTYRYAVVLENPPQHSPIQQPYFRIEVVDSVNSPVSPCAQYYQAADSIDPGFVLSTSFNGPGCPVESPVYYKPWSPVTVDLSAYINHSVTVRFTVGGCTLGGHFGYAYVDCACANIGASVSAFFCPGASGAFLVAPSGFGAYQWYDPHGNVIPGATNDSLLTTTASANDTFSVHMTSLTDTNCVSIVSVIVQLTPVLTNPTSVNPTCYEYTDGTATENCSNCFPPISYTWTSIPTQSTQTATNLAAGQYLVTITDSIGCTKTDTVLLRQPPRPDTSAITYHYCYGDASVTLVALPGEPGYQWLDAHHDTIAGATAPTYLVTNPGLGQVYYCIYATNPCPILDSIIMNYVPPFPLFSPDSTVNIFTPNGDGKNDYFYPYYTALVSNQTSVAGGGQPAYDFYNLYVGTYELWVYDRWGAQVFYTNDYNIGWNGQVHGKDAVPGVYYWVAKFTSRCKEDETPITSTGFVHLIR